MERYVSVRKIGHPEGPNSFRAATWRIPTIEYARPEDDVLKENVKACV